METRLADVSISDSLTEGIVGAGGALSNQSSSNLSASGNGCGKPTSSTNQSAAETAAATSETSYTVNGSNSSSSAFDASRVTSVAVEDVRGGGASSDDDLLSDLGCADSADRKKNRRANQRRSLSDRYSAERKDQ